MSAPASRPDPATADRAWRVVVDMPVFETGPRAGEPVGWLTMNTTAGGVKAKIERGVVAQLWRKASFTALVVNAVPRGLGRIEVQAEFQFIDSRKRDVDDNFHPTLKPVIDALGPQRIYRVKSKKKPEAPPKLVVELGRGIVADDDRRFVTRLPPLVGPPLGGKSFVRGRVILHIRQLPPEA